MKSSFVESTNPEVDIHKTESFSRASFSFKLLSLKITGPNLRQFTLRNQIANQEEDKSRIA